MPTVEKNRDTSQKRPALGRRRFVKAGLLAGASGLLSLFGLTGRAGRKDLEPGQSPGAFSRSPEELAG